MLKINICILMALISSYSLADCSTPSKKSNQVTTFDSYAGKDPFDIKKIDKERIKNDENSFFVWRSVNDYYFSLYPAYLNSGYTREKIQNSVFFCTFDEMDYIFENNVGNEISIYLINSPYDNAFLDRGNKLLAKINTYSHVVNYLHERAVKYKIKLFILDDDNWGGNISRQIK